MPFWYLLGVVVGMLSALSVFIQRVESFISQARHKSPSSASAASPKSLSEPTPLQSDEIEMALRLKNSAWRVLMYLMSFLLSQPPGIKRQQCVYSLASQLGPHLTAVLCDHAARIAAAGGNPEAEITALRQDWEVSYLPLVHRLHNCCGICLA